MARSHENAMWKYVRITSIEETMDKLHRRADPKAAKRLDCEQLAAAFGMRQTVPKPRQCLCGLVASTAQVKTIHSLKIDQLELEDYL
jgi:hypothetical protein